jgi:tetratricopeptide (TPR) repeat protein
MVKCLNELTAVVVQTGTLAESERMVRQVVAMQRKVLGPEHADVADSLDSLAGVLTDEGELAEAEETQRESLAMNRKLLGERHPTVAWSVYNLAGILINRGKFAEAEAASREAVTKFEALDNNKNVPPLILDGLTEVLRAEGKSAEAAALSRERMARSELGRNESVARHPGEPGPFVGRGFLRGRMGRWREAAADLSRVAELRSDDYGYYNNLDDHYLVFLGAALVEAGDLEAYRRLGGRIRQRFGGTDSGELATLMAWACLLGPSPEQADMATISRLADTGVDRYQGNVHLVRRQSCKALAEYRQGRFASAAEWASRALSQPECRWDRELRRRADCRRVDASMVLAMAKYQLHQLDEARAALSRGMEIADQKLPKLESGDLGEGWDEWVFTDLLTREAKALIEGDPKTGDEGKTIGPSSPRKDPP